MPSAPRPPRRLLVVRASFLLLGAAALLAGSQAEEPLRLGEGAHVFEWVRGWAKLPAGMELGNTHGCIVVDSRDRIYVNTDTENAVVVFDADGNFLSAWGKELAGGLHGMLLAKEEGGEVLYLAHTGRHEVLKASLEGEILWRLPYPAESGIYASAAEYLPTSLALGPKGELFVADGYGSSWIHEYDAERRYVRSFGGPGSEPGRLQTPHGLWLDTRGEAPVLLVADRENHRLQSFSLSGEPLGRVEDVLRRPCHMHPRGKELAVADLAGRVTLLGAENELLLHLGDNPDPAKRAQNGIPREAWRDGEFIAPHCANWDSQGNLYVMDWLAQGRVSKLRRVR